MSAALLKSELQSQLDLTLHDVTLVAVTSVALPATVRAMRLSQRSILFEDAVLLSDRPAKDDGAIRWAKIDPIRSRAEYSRFMLHDLHAHIKTTHALCVQWDGYVLRPASWDPTFLRYDYIGAPWPHFPTDRVGNGGFSLRSKRLLSATAKLGIEGDLEDVTICRIHRRQLEEEHGIIFAPEEIASRFAWERAKPRGDEFGFHGVFNLVNHTSSEEIIHIIEGLESEMLNDNEHRELLRWAIVHGRVAMARRVWRRMRDRMT